jgi:uncharacterized protein YqjF (DUF2071 family)
VTEPSIEVSSSAVSALRNDQRTAGYQRWQKLSFLHWRVPAELLQSLIPPSLTIESFDGSAWLGLVPFSMESIRPWWSPAVPGISWFLETNVRTYVVDRRGVPGVWFFSLDANKQLAVTLARTFWHLPYKMATLSLECNDAADQVRSLSYKGHRTDSPRGDYTISVTVDRSLSPVVSAPGSLEHFLLERYVLFAQRRNGQMMTGVVHHAPYLYRSVRECHVQQSMTDAMGCSTSGRSPDHVAYSDGVDVRVSPLTAVSHNSLPA